MLSVEGWLARPRSWYVCEDALIPFQSMTTRLNHASRCVLLSIAATEQESVGQAQQLCHPYVCAALTQCARLLISPLQQQPVPLGFLLQTTSPCSVPKRGRGGEKARGPARSFAFCVCTCVVISLSQRSTAVRSQEEKPACLSATSNGDRAPVSLVV